MNSIIKAIEIKTTIIVILISVLLSIFILFLSNRFDSYVIILAVFGVPTSLLLLRSAIISIVRLKGVFSKLQWWHYLWLLVFLSGLVFRIRDTDTIQKNPIDLWALYRIALVCFVGYILLIRLALDKTDWTSALFRGSIGLIGGYVLICILSIFWSIQPMWSIYKSLEYLIDLILIAAIVSSAKSIDDYMALFNWTWVLFGILMASAWIGVVLWPDKALNQGVGVLGIQLSGVLPALETNKVGELGALVGIIAFNRFIFMKDKRFFLVILLIAISTMIIAQSRTPITGFVLAVCLMLFVSRRIGPFALTAMLMIVILSITGVADVFWEYFLRGQNRESFSSLTGRTYGWALGWDLFMRNPFIGVGAYAGGRFAVLTEVTKSMDTTQWSSVLNTWLEILMSVGLVGIIFVALAFFRTWKLLIVNSFISRNGSLIHCLTVEAIGVLTLISVRSMFTTNIIWHPPLLFFLVMGYAEFLARIQRQERIIRQISARTYVTG